MRAQLENILTLQRQVAEKIEIYQQESKVPEYRHFWHNLAESHQQDIESISRYMVMKCNR